MGYASNIKATDEDFFSVRLRKSNIQEEHLTNTYSSLKLQNMLKNYILFISYV